MWDYAADLKSRGVVFESYDFPGFDKETGIAEHDSVRSAWFKDSEGNTLILHQLTRRLWSWREEYGSTQTWRREVGRLVAEVGVEQLWLVVNQGSEVLTPA